MRLRSAWPRAAATGSRRSGGTPERRLRSAIATAFQPHAPSVPRSMTVRPGSSGGRATGKEASTVRQQEEN
eukprot:9768050-Alexandrium_andersonii.AAC.1